MYSGDTETHETLKKYNELADDIHEENDETETDTSQQTAVSGLSLLLTENKLLKRLNEKINILRRS